MARLKSLYRETVVASLTETFSYGNRMEVPRLQKIVINSGVGEAAQDPKVLEGTMIELTAVTGQKPAVRRSRKAISNFKLREGMPVGAVVTLRRERMFEFLDRLVNLALPQTRDFRGLPPTAFDGMGNYNLGIREQIIFPEIDYDKIDRIRGMNITMVTSAKTDDEARELLRLLGVPFAN